MKKNDPRLKPIAKNGKPKKSTDINVAGANISISANKKRKDYLKWGFDEVVERFDFVENIQKETSPYKKRTHYEIQRDEEHLNERRVEIFRTDRLPSELLKKLDSSLPPSIENSGSELEQAPEIHNALKSNSLMDNFKANLLSKVESITQSKQRSVGSTDQFTDKLNTNINSVDHIYDLDEDERVFILPESSKRKHFRSKYVSKPGSFEKVSRSIKQSTESTDKKEVTSLVD